MLDKKIKNQWGYALVAGLSATIFAMLFGWTATGLESGIKDVLTWSVFGLVAFPAAAFCWPRKQPRGLLRMAYAGVTTVAASFFLVGLSIWAGVTVQASGDRIATFFGGMIFVVLVPFVGSLFTFGIPYAIAIALSLPFADKRTGMEADWSG